MLCYTVSQLNFKAVFVATISWCSSQRESWHVFLSFFYFFKCALTTLNNDFKLTLPSLDMGQLFESLFMTRNQFSNLSHTHTQSWLIINFLFFLIFPFSLIWLMVCMLCAWALKSVGTNANFNFFYRILIWLCDYGPINLKLQLLPPKGNPWGEGEGEICASQSSKVRMSGGTLKLWIDWCISVCKEYLLYFLIQLACFNFRIFVSEI